MQRCFAAFECRPRHIVITGRAWHEGGSADAAGDACRRARSGGWSRRHPFVAGVRAACRARRCLHRDCRASSTRRAACRRWRHAQRVAAWRTRAQPAHTGRRQRFAKRHLHGHSVRSGAGGAERAAAASIVGTTQAACHAGIRRHGHGRWHGRRWTQRARRSVTVRMFGCRRAKATAARRRRSGRDWLAGRAACRPHPAGGPRGAADRRSAVSVAGAPRAGGAGKRQA